MTTYLVATDLSIRGDRAVARAIALARQTGAKLVMASVVDDTLPDGLVQLMLQAAESQMADQARAASQGAPLPAMQIIARPGDPAADIVDLAAETGADLLILGVHRPRALRDAFGETTMQRIARCARCPVLLVQDPVVGPYQRLLAAVDFSPAAAQALSAGAAILPPEAEILALHALHLPFKGFLGQGASAADLAPYRAEAEAAEIGWRARHALPARLGAVALHEGGLTELLTEALAEARDIGGPVVLALGLNARSGLQRLVVGSQCHDLMRAPPCDLLVARGA